MSHNDLFYSNLNISLVVFIVMRNRVVCFSTVDDFFSIVTLNSRSKYNNFLTARGITFSNVMQISVLIERG